MGFQIKLPKLPKFINPVSLFWGIYIPLVLTGYYKLFTNIFSQVQ